jgi:hypothetical protein
MSPLSFVFIEADWVLSYSNCALYPTFSVVLNSWKPPRPLPHPKIWPGTFSNAPYNNLRVVATLRHCVMMRVQALRPTLQSPKNSSAPHDADIFLPLPQVVLKAGTPLAPRKLSMCACPSRSQPLFDDLIGVLPRRRPSYQAPRRPGASQDPLDARHRQRGQMKSRSAAR